MEFLLPLPFPLVVCLSESVMCELCEVGPQIFLSRAAFVVGSSLRH